MIVHPDAVATLAEYLPLGELPPMPLGSPLEGTGQLHAEVAALSALARSGRGDTQEAADLALRIAAVAVRDVLDLCAAAVPE